MPVVPQHRVLIAFALFDLTLFAAGARGERLPIREYTAADGLPHNGIDRIVSDSRGLLWFGTTSGLSRFDGEQFVNYLPGQAVFDIAEGPDGRYWIGIWRGGLACFDPQTRDPQELIRPVRGDYPRGVRRLLFDPTGTLWIGTSGGLFASDGSCKNGEVRRVVLDAAADSPTPEIWDLLVDRAGTLWIATGDGGLFARSPGGRVVSQPLVPGGEPHGAVRGLAEDRDGQIWVAHDLGVTRIDPRIPADWRWFGPEVVGEGIVLDVFQSAESTLWFSRHGKGLTRYDGNRFETLGVADGFPYTLPYRFAEDIGGNLWIGTYDAGAIRIATSGFTAYGKDDGLEFSRYATILEDRAGRIVASVGDTMYELDADRFRAIRPAALRGLGTGRQRENPAVLQDRRGQWWLGTRRGLFLHAPQPIVRLAADEAAAYFSRVDGLPGDHVGRLFEDSRGGIWLAYRDAHGVSCWDPTSKTWTTFAEDPGLPRAFASAFVEDRAGNLWVGFEEGLARLRSGHFTAFDEDDGLPAGLFVEGLYVDRSGRLWILSPVSGVFVVTDPTAERPAFARFDGLSDARVRCAAEDREGRVYLGGMSGITRIDPGTGQVRQFTTRDGLSSNDVKEILVDRNGALWFTSVQGVSRLVPRADPAAPPPPPIWITRLRIAGEPRPLAELGESRIEGLRIEPHLGNIELEFGSRDFDPTHGMRYQHKLEGADLDWSAPSPQRAVNYASLSPGRYRFVVRALDARGQASESPAVLAFRVLPPIWLRSWFLLLAGAVVVGLLHLAHRVRITRLLEFERVRTRIATDLHDDIGSSLSQIAILSEVVQRRLGRTEETVTEPLARIANESRELVDSMSDIVWAIDPRRDHLRDVVQRMRRFASDALAPRGIELRFRAPAGSALKLGPDLRRELYLVFKESLHNVVKHADCRTVEIDLAVDDVALTLTIRDDGRGFPPAAGSDGHGLASMAARARRLGGKLVVQSHAGTGSRVQLRVPFGRRRGTLPE